MVLAPSPLFPLFIDVNLMLFANWRPNGLSTSRLTLCLRPPPLFLFVCNFSGSNCVSVFSCKYMFTEGCRQAILAWKQWKPFVCLPIGRSGESKGAGCMAAGKWHVIGHSFGPISISLLLFLLHNKEAIE